MNRVPLTPERIKEIIDGSKKPEDAIIGLYTEIPGFHECKSTTGHPIVSEKTWSWILQQMNRRFFDAFTSITWIGMVWMNYGFSGSPIVPEWEIDLELNNFKLID